MGNGGISQSAIVNQTNIMVSNVIVNIALYCNTQDISDQMISVKCNPQYQNASIVWEQNSSCQACVVNVTNNQLQYYKNVERLWNSKPAGVSLPINQDFQNIINDFVSCGLNSCKACVLENVSQSSVITSVLNCQAFNNVQNTISQQMIAQVTQNLTNNQDMLAPLAEMLGSSSTSDVIYNVTNRIMTLLTEDVVANLTQQVSNNQTLSLNLHGGETQIIGSTQNSAYNSVMKYLGDTNLLNNILESSQWDELLQLYNEQNTIDSLGNTIVASVNLLTQLLNNVVGQVVIIVLCLVVVIFLAMVIYVITNLIKNSVKKKHAKDELLSEQAEKVAAFESF